MKKKNSALLQGLLYIILGIVFVYFAVIQVDENGWGVFAYVIIAMATIDFVTGFRFIFVGLREKMNKK
ncbi:YdiK family protein [Listeria costaricensis]|uniref:YdiK family protein n=1 Tax=Listeria costaricensis TaxID=2026604 RepID=UPI000C076C3E|nr:YdiK family protein [Listeria costaricensis]